MSNIKIKINSNATKQMQAIINKIDTFPNRIASAQQSALIRSIPAIYTSLGRMSSAAYHIDFDIQQSGALGYKMTLKPPNKGRKSKDGNEAYYAVLMFIKGRPGGQILRSRSGKMMKLRDESVRKGYPEYLRQVKLGSMPNNEEKIKREMRETVLKNLEYVLKRFGFGPRGGTAGLEDLPRIRSRAGNSR